MSQSYSGMGPVQVLRCNEAETLIRTLQGSDLILSRSRPHIPAHTISFKSHPGGAVKAEGSKREEHVMNTGTSCVLAVTMGCARPHFSSK